MQETQGFQQRAAISAQKQTAQAHRSMRSLPEGQTVWRQWRLLLPLASSLQHVHTMSQGCL